MPPRYVIAIVELDDQEGLRVTTNLTGIAPEEVSIGQAVQVVFERHGDVWYPLFESVTACATALRTRSSSPASASRASDATLATPPCRSPSTRFSPPLRTPGSPAPTSMASCPGLARSATPAVSPRPAPVSAAPAPRS